MLQIDHVANRLNIDHVANRLQIDHVANRLNNEFWIDHVWEFLDNRGSLRDDLYGRLGIHLKGKGKGMMARCIRSFQQSFN